MCTNCYEIYSGCGIVVVRQSRELSFGVDHADHLIVCAFCAEEMRNADSISYSGRERIYPLRLTKNRAEAVGVVEGVGALDYGTPAQEVLGVSLFAALVEVGADAVTLFAFKIGEKQPQEPEGNGVVYKPALFGAGDRVDRADLLCFFGNFRQIRHHRFFIRDGDVHGIKGQILHESPHFFGLKFYKCVGIIGKMRMDLR